MLASGFCKSRTLGEPIFMSAAALFDVVVTHLYPRLILNGELGAIRNLVAQKAESLTPAAEVRLSVVAGIGFEPMTFRL
jgi:hypothetical protein